MPLRGGVSTRIFFAPATSGRVGRNLNVFGLTDTNSGGFKERDLFVPGGYSRTQGAPLRVRLPDPLYKFPLNALLP